MSNDNLLSKAMQETILSRRSFLKWSSALGGAAVVAGGLGVGMEALQAVETTELDVSSGTWVPSACWGLYIILLAPPSGVGLSLR